jgi:hypothetical protein
MEVVLQRIGDEPTVEPDPRFPTKLVPALWPEEVVHHLVEVGIVGELDVPTDVPGEALLIDERRGEAAGIGGAFDQEPIVDPMALEPPRCSEAARARAEDEDLDPLSGAHH